MATPDDIRAIGQRFVNLAEALSHHNDPVYAYSELRLIYGELSTVILPEMRKAKVAHNLQVNNGVANARI